MENPHRPIRQSGGGVRNPAVPRAYFARKENLQAVVISRSGSTSEAVRAAAVLRNEHRIPTLGLTCTPDSPLEATCELTIRISAADETSMVMTRSFTSMLLVMQYLAAAKGGAKDFCVALETLAQRFAPLLPVFAENLDAFTAKHDFEDYIFLGQGPFQGIVREAALKVTEMSCSYSQSFHTLEFRHGPKSIVTSAACLTFFISEQGKDAECEVLAEMKKLGGVILTVCNRRQRNYPRVKRPGIRTRIGSSGVGHSGALHRSVATAGMLYRHKKRPQPRRTQKPDARRAARLIVGPPPKNFDVAVVGELNLDIILSGTTGES